MVKLVNLKPGFHPQGLMKNVPKLPSFSIRSATPMSGSMQVAPYIFCEAEFPQKKTLDGFYLVVVPRIKALSFGLAHPLWVDGPEAPYKEAFSILQTRKIMDFFASAGHIDVQFSNRVRDTMFLRFTAMTWIDLMEPQKLRERLESESRAG